MKIDSYDKFVAKLARAKLLRCAGFIFAGKMKALGNFAIFLVLLVLADGEMVAPTSPVVDLH